MLGFNEIYNMDCLEGMKRLSDNSIDSIVTDPPYELGFMNKKWDKTGIAYNTDAWKEALRVLKPGGYLLSFGGTRTYHRMACAIEDAGFIIHPMIAWVYGTGFPKATNLSKQFDKQAGVEREIIGDNPNARPNSQPNYSLDGKNKNFSINVQPITAPTTPEAQQWDGWYYGLQSLKPAIEPICMAQKPIDGKRMTDNVVKWGTGAVNIDGCRIGTEMAGARASNKDGVTRRNMAFGMKEFEGNPVKGRFPANVILDEEAGKLLDEQSGILKSGTLKPYQENHQNASSYKMNRYKTFVQPANEGGASRFFYCAKASKKERGEGNNHPTVKPIKLIEYLVKLITPPDGISLDPFMGSGTHALVCKQLNRNYIGFEISKEYCDIAEKRLNNCEVIIS